MQRQYGRCIRRLVSRNFSEYMIYYLLKGGNCMSDNTDNKPLFQINLSGLKITSDAEPYVILGEAIKDTSFADGLQISISDKVKTYPRMYYTTDLTALGFIMGKLTLRCSSLTYAKLNDPVEKARVGVEQFAGSKFITCFSHVDHEIVPFWTNYGGTDRTQKILLKFKNFTADFSATIHTDYALLDGDKKLFFESEELHKTINQNGPIGQSMGFAPINTDYDLRNSIARIDVFDVDYLPANDRAFSDDYSGEANIDFTKVASNSADTPILSDIKIFRTGCLGKQKSNPWEYEGESRILCSLSIQDFDKWNFIDLRLKEEIFRDMTIVLSPWLSPDLEDKVKEIISSSPISDEIKRTIQIEHSVVEGSINI